MYEAALGLLKVRVVPERPFQQLAQHADSSGVDCAAQSTRRATAKVTSMRGTTMDWGKNCMATGCKTGDGRGAGKGPSRAVSIAVPVPLSFKKIIMKTKISS